ncbi:unnamed protein product, partial [marine sediment metagenome]
ERQDSKELIRNYKEFDKLLKILLIVGIIIISGFIIYALVTPKPGKWYLGILNSDKKAENYPTNVAVDDNITFYISVGNYLNRDFSFHIEILRGGNDTILSSSPSLNATSFVNSSKITLPHRATWISSAFNISFSQVGANQSIIAELWEIPSVGVRRFYDVVFVRLNITS